MHWNIDSTEYLYRHPPYFIARKDTCTLPDGRAIPAYYVVELPPAVITFCITNDEKVLFIKQYRHPVGIVSIELPGGFINEGESPEAAAKRETEEETGFRFNTISYLGKIAGNPGILNNFTFLFVATGGIKKMAPHVDQQEDICTLLLSFDEIKQLIQENKIIQSLHLNACFYALQHLGKLTLL